MRPKNPYVASHIELDEGGLRLDVLKIWRTESRKQNFKSLEAKYLCDHAVRSPEQMQHLLASGCLDKKKLEQLLACFDDESSKQKHSCRGRDKSTEGVPSPAKLNPKELVALLAAGSEVRRLP